MKQVNSIYDNIVDTQKIMKMYDKRIRINTKNKTKLLRFEYNYVSNIVYIKNILEDRKYIPGKYNIFIIKEPKLRLIMSQNIIDKIINHLVSEYLLVEVFDKTLIDSNIATRKNKGTDYGIKLLKKYIKKLNNNKFYILKFDISKYFYNLDHEILKNIISKKIKDKDAINLLYKIIDSTDYSYINKRINDLKNREIEKILNSNKLDKERLINEIKSIPEYKKGKGLPIGNMSSQFLAILYLNELDHYIKEELKIKYYIRYMDDGILLHTDKEYLKNCLKEIEKILERYGLKLNNKTRIYSSDEGFEFLGYKYIMKNNRLIVKIKGQTKRRFKRKMKTLYKLEEQGKITKKDVMHVEASYKGHLHYGNTKKLIENTIKKEKIGNLEFNKVYIEDNKIVYINT